MSPSQNRGAANPLPSSPQGPLKLVDDSWLVGHRNPEAMLQCNTYLRKFNHAGNKQNICIDPGSQFDYPVVESNILELVDDLRDIHGMTINHQDPDVAGNAPQFCEGNPKIDLIVTEEVWRLLQHMMINPGKVRLSHGTQGISQQHPFQFVPTPFCHFRGAMALYDPEHQILYSGDLFGGLNRLGDVHLMANEDDWNGIAQFHQIYMPSREVLRYAVRQILNLRPKVKIIAPQHGHVIMDDLVDVFLERMHELPVGNDLLAEDWDVENLSGYRETIQRLVDVAEQERSDVIVACRLSAQEANDELHAHLQLHQHDVYLQREGYSALAKTFARLAEGEPAQYIAKLRDVVAEACEEFGLPIPPAASGFHKSSSEEQA